MDIFDIASTLIILVFSVIVHEIAHGWVALKCGDPTARDAGRLTLNPIPHIDPFMTIIVPAFFLISGVGIVLGGAKPVPVNLYNLRGGEKDNVKVSLAGVGANFLLALIAGFLMIVSAWYFTHSGGNQFGLTLYQLFRKIVWLNLILANFNLLPIPPLDGSWVLGYFLKGEARRGYARLQARGFQVFLVFMVAAYLIPSLWRIVFWPAMTMMRLIQNFILVITH